MLTNRLNRKSLELIHSSIVLHQILIAFNDNEYDFYDTSSAISSQAPY
jgi:hypothetical protein